MRHLFIINPAAGKKNSTALLEKKLAALSFPHEVAFTEGEGDARRIAARAAAGQESLRIYACGGDGTLNEVVNAAAGLPHVAVTNVPKGTGNDFLKIFGPHFRELFSDLEALAAGPQASFDLMDCNGLLGLDVVCAGVDARIAEGVHKFKNWHFVSGRGAYLLSLVEQVLFKGISRPMTVRMGGLDWENRPTAIVCVCNGRYYGGGFMPVGEAMPDDGVLDMLVVRDVSLLTLARLVGQYGKGQYRKYPQYITPWKGREITFSASEEFVAVVDGEVLHDRQFTVRLSEKKVNFFYPAGAGYAPAPGFQT